MRRENDYYYWRLLRTEAGRPKMAFYELRHFCATHLLELEASHADVVVQLGHTDGGALVMSPYGHPSIKHRWRAFLRHSGATPRGV